MKIIYALMLLFGSVLLLGCDNSNDEAPPPTVASLSITPSSVPELPVGGTQTFTATGIDTSGNTYDATLYTTWVSSDTNVATIDALGVATTIAVGTTTISASSAGIDASNTVGLTVATDPVPPPSDPSDYSPDNVCRAEFCATDDALSQTCQTFLAACIANEPANEDECVGGALVICQNPDLNAGDVCDYERCGTDPDLQQQCEDFLLVCSDESLNAEECVGAMIFFCRADAD